MVVISNEAAEANSAGMAEARAKAVSKAVKFFNRQPPSSLKMGCEYNKKSTCKKGHRPYLTGASVVSVHSNMIGVLYQAADRRCQ